MIIKIDTEKEIIIAPASAEKQVEKMNRIAKKAGVEKAFNLKNIVETAYKNGMKKGIFTPEEAAAYNIKISDKVAENAE